MFFDNLSRLYVHKLIKCGYFTTHIRRKMSLELSQLFNIPKSEAEYIALKYPVINKLNEVKMKNLIETLYNLGLSKETLIEEPLLFSIAPVTLEHRFKVLQECGLNEITGQAIASYLHIIRKTSIQELRNTLIINPNLNIENRLASYMTQWPTSLTTLIYDNINTQTLFELRLKILQRYLELILDLNEDEFNRGLRTYPTIKHRPLRMINETLTLLQAKIMMPITKIKSNFYVLHSNSGNLKQILYKLRSIGGIDIKEILRMHPKLCVSNYSNMVEIKRILEEYGISNDAQRRCFDIFTLSHETVKERLEKTKKVPEFQVYLNHPRFLKIILYNKNATQRMYKLYDSNKKCLSLNSLTGCSDHFKKFEKAPGDRSGKGKDLLHYLVQELGKEFTISDLRKNMNRHQFWINIPVVHVKLVYQKLAFQFSTQDIYENCIILLYPLNTIKHLLQLFNANNKAELCKLLPFFEDIEISKLSNTQILSLTLYTLEKKHYFSGNGVWTDEKLKEANQIMC